MPEVVDSFTFDKGVNTRKNPTTLNDGEMQVCSGFAFTKDGELSPLLPRASVGNIQLGTIRNIHRCINYVYVQEGETIQFKWDLDGYCNLYVPPTPNFTQTKIVEAARGRVTDYTSWTFFVNGFKNLALNGQYAFDWALPNPETPPGGAAGSAGNPNGAYSLYYTFLFKFPNGEVYESGPSPAGSITVSSTAIVWNGIGTCSYSPNTVNYWTFEDWYYYMGYSPPIPTNPITLAVLHAGFALWLTINSNIRSITSGTVKIYRRLYRYSVTLGAIFYVTDIPNNLDTTYTDDFADSTINTNDVLTTEEYGPVPDDITAVETYLQRIFFVKEHLLGWTEPYLPFNVKSSSSMPVSSEGDNLTGCIYWGDTLYMPSKAGWRRLAGSDPDTWAVREVFADKGIINPDTVQKTKYGIMGLWYDGICLFDGSTSRNITEKILGTTLFTSTIGADNYASCWATYDGSKYFFYYPSGCFIIDLSLYPDIRVYSDPLVLTAQEYHDPTGIRYMGYDGYQYEMTSGAGTAIDLVLLTGEKVGQNILQRKNIKYLYYDIDTGGLDVTATVYLDGVAQTPTFTINTSTRKRDRIEQIPASWEGYRISLRLSCAAITGVKPIIYGPWAIQSTPVGQ
jgi:hypothetical protein